MNGSNPDNCRSSHTAHLPSFHLIAIPFLLGIFLVSQVAAQEKLGGRQIVKLGNEAYALAMQQKYADALPLAKQAYDAAEFSLGPKDKRTREFARNLAIILLNLNRYPEARTYFDRAILLAANEEGEKSQFLATLLVEACNTAEKMDDKPGAEGYQRRALSIQLLMKGPTSTDTLQAMDHLGDLLRWQRKWAEAKQFYDQAAAARRDLKPPTNLGTSLTNYGWLENDQANYDRAIPFFEKALKKDTEEEGPNGNHMLRDLYNMKFAYAGAGDWVKAEQFQKRYLSLYEETYPHQSGVIIQGLTTLAQMASTQGEFSAAEKFANEAVDRINKSQDQSLQAYSFSAELALSEIYIETGRYSEGVALSERLLKQQPSAIDTKIRLLLDKAAGEGVQGQYAAAEKTYREALKLTITPDYHATRQVTFRESQAIAVLQLADLLKLEGRVAESEATYEQAPAAIGAVQNKGTRSGLLCELALYYLRHGQAEEAEPLLRDAAKLGEESYGTHSFEYARLCHLLGVARWIERKYDEAEALYKQSMSLLEATVGFDHSEAGTLFADFSNLEMARGNISNADALFQKSIVNGEHQLKFAFQGMSERERLEFLRRMLERFDQYYSFVERNRDSPALVIHAYDLALWQKGLVVEGMSRLHRRLGDNPGDGRSGIYAELAQKRAQIASLYNSLPNSSSPELRSRLAQLEGEANELDRKFTAQDLFLADQLGTNRVTWQQVRGQLKSGEAAVEFVRFRYFDGRTWSKESHYFAFVLRPDSEAPALVDIGASSSVEAVLRKSYQAMVKPAAALSTANSPSTADREINLTVWKPLQERLGTATRVYLAPDGALNSINLALIPTLNGRRLIDDIDLRLLNSTRELLQRSNTATGLKRAVILGNPDFDLSSGNKTGPVEAAKRSADAGFRRSRDQDTGPLPSLPGTADEVRAISDLLREKGWQVDTLLGDRATEESLKQVGSPTVLHIATHGFFLPKKDSDDGDTFSEDPMLRSGLFLAGANRTLEGDPLPSSDDGILTSIEAVDLNLSGTSLVVLSACDTGLGQTESGEGVFGLRRAFGEAGARAVLMSMWSVPDRETQELMVLFYKNLMDGKGKHQALREAQLQMRSIVEKRYGTDAVYYWGAFVIVGQ
jgi:CHAT domain-containing protein/tetratricopeptide (TPR) repeat protein